MQDNEIIKFKEDHQGDWKTFFKIYESDKPFWETWFFFAPLILSAIFVITGLFFSVDFYYLLTKEILPNIFSTIPSLLGFSLGGFILVVGFGSLEILRNITISLQKQKGFSFYQKMISVLGVSVLIQILTLSLNFTIQIINSLGLTSDYYASTIINSIVTFVLVFLVFYSFSQLLVVVRHVFMFGQTIQANIRIEELIEKRTEES